MENTKVNIKIMAPKIPKCLEKLYVEDDIQDKDSFSSGIVEDCTIENQNAEHVAFNEIIFRNVIFKDVSFYCIDLTDVRLENCDLSNVDLRGAVIHRTEFINCKIVGINLAESTLRNVLFEECNGRYASFRFSDCKQVNFKKSLLLNGDYQKCEFSKVAFMNCNLQQVEMSGTTLKGMDFTSCDIDGMGARMENLFGVIVSPDQTVTLARLMGVVVKI